MITVKLQKTGDVVIKMRKGDYALLRQILSDMAATGNTAAQVDHVGRFVEFFPRIS